MNTPTDTTTRMNHIDHQCMRLFLFPTVGKAGQARGQKSWHNGDGHGSRSRQHSTPHRCHQQRSRERHCNVLVLEQSRQAGVPASRCSTRTVQSPEPAVIDFDNSTSRSRRWIRGNKGIKNAEAVVGNPSRIQHPGHE